jgi:hypothetical protein
MKSQPQIALIDSEKPIFEQRVSESERGVPGPQDGAQILLPGTA